MNIVNRLCEHIDSRYLSGKNRLQIPYLGTIREL